MAKKTQSMTPGQRALYEVAVDTERCRNFLINLAVLQTEVRQKNFQMAGMTALVLLAFVIGFGFGRL